jgi:flagellar basal body-associated protein FliL
MSSQMAKAKRVRMMWLGLMVAVVVIVAAAALLYNLLY